MDKIRAFLHKTSTKMFLSYLMAVTLPLILICMIAYTLFFNTLKKSYEARYIDSIQSAGVDLNNRFNELYELSNELSKNKWLRDLAMFTDSDTSYMDFIKYDSYELIRNQLTNYLSLNGFIENFAICFPQQKFVLYPNGLDFFSWFFDNTCRYEEYSEDDFYEMLAGEESLNAPYFFGPNTVWEYRTKKEYYTYIFPIYIETNHPPVYIMYYIDSETIDYHLSKVAPDGYSVAYLYDYNYRLLASFGNDNILREELSKWVADSELNNVPDSGKLSVEIQNRNGYQILNCTNPTPLYGFQILSIHSEKAIKDQLYFFTYLFWGIGSIFLISMILILYITNSRVYTPIRHLMDIVKKTSHVPVADTVEDDFIYLEASIQKMIDEQQVNEKTLEQYQSLVLKTNMEDFINGCEPETVRNAMLALQEKGFTYPRFLVILTDQCLPESSSQSIYADPSHHFLIWNQANTSIVLLNLQEETLSENSLPEHLLTQIGRSDITLGVGTPHAPETVYLSYNEAKIALEYQRTKQLGGICLYQSIHFLEDKRYYYKIFEEKAHKISPENLSEYLNHVLQENIEQSSVTISTERLLFYKRVQSQLQKLSVDQIKILADQYCPKIHKAPSSDILQELLEQLFRSLICADLKQKGNYSDDLFREILSYIDAHFADTNFSQSIIAQQFQMSPSKLSLLFKEKAGVNFLSYLMEKRISIAQKLLKTTKMTIEEVAHQSGFENVYTFRRVFKTLTSQTPSAYRDHKEDSIDK